MSTVQQPVVSVNESPAMSPLLPEPLQGRIQSLDVFRGITMAAMVVVNNAGDWAHVYAPLEHSPWHGCTPTDLVFPFFVFIVGVAIPFSSASRRRQLAQRGFNESQQNRALVVNATRRAAILFALGMFLYAIPINLAGPTGRGILDPGTLRIPGVLQRIALCYLAASILTILTDWRTRAAIAVVLLIGYTLLMRFVPVPGFGPGNLTADGSLASYLDRLLLGRHTYRPNYDPEGLLSTLPAVATALIGTFAGQWLRTARPATDKAAALLAFGVIGALLGYVTNGLLLPINKPLWTPSYVLYTGGLALLGFGWCYWMVDMLGHNRWARPFTILGMNAIAVYVLSGILGRVTLLVKVHGADGKNVYLKTWLYDRLFAPLTSAPMHISPYVASMLWGLSYLLLCAAVATWMYRRKIFLKV